MKNDWHMGTSKGGAGMKYDLRGLICHNADIEINADSFDEPFKKCVTTTNFGTAYKISYKTDNMHSMAMFLEQLIVAYRVTWPHYDLLPQLIEMTMYIHDCVKCQSIRNGIIIKDLKDEDHEGTGLALEIRSN